MVFRENFTGKDGDRCSETAVLHTKLPFSKKASFVDEAFGSRGGHKVDILRSTASAPSPDCSFYSNNIHRSSQMVPFRVPHGDQELTLHLTTPGPFPNIPHFSSMAYLYPKCGLLVFLRAEKVGKKNKNKSEDNIFRTLLESLNTGGRICCVFSV